MAATDESAGGDREASRAALAPDFEERPEISAYSTTERRTVFTESDNSDGWIATELTVEIRA